jgi:hypothetical protein
MIELEPNRDYAAVVKTAYLLESAVKGTPGLEIVFSPPDTGGEPDWLTPAQLWLTPSRRESTEKVLKEVFGCTPAQLKKLSFWQSIGEFLQGKPATITTKMEEYNGKQRVKVAWINPPKKAPSMNLAQVAADLFAAPAEAAGPAITDDDVPF